MPENTAADRTERLRAHAMELGFHAFGVAEAGPADPEGHLRAWLDAGYHGSMAWMADTYARRARPSESLPGARSVVAVAISYYRESARTDGPLKVARYAQGQDYHRWLKRRIRKLRKALLRLDPGCKVYPTVDTSPVLERFWAERAGIAWIGKSAMAIHPRLGTYTFLGTLVTDSELTPSHSIPDRCGTCTACLTACPTQAFVRPRVLDSRRCISYWTLEVRGDTPADAPPPHGWIAGCDVCQEVCPWNKFARESDAPPTRPRPDLSSPPVETVSQAKEQEGLEAILRGTALQRTGPEAIRRNALRVLTSVRKP